MRNLVIPIGHLVMLAELDDKEAGQMAKAIASYANEGTVPTFSNGALKAIFSLFRSTIESQRESSAKRSEINTTNAMSKKSAAKKKVAKKLPTADSESQQIVNEDANTSEVTDESLPLRCHRSHLSQTRYLSQRIALNLGNLQRREEA